MFSGLNPLEDFLVQQPATPAIIRSVGKFRPRPNAQSKTEIPKITPQLPVISQTDSSEPAPSCTPFNSLVVKPCDSSSTAVLIPESANLRENLDAESPLFGTDGTSKGVNFSVPEEEGAEIRDSFFAEKGDAEVFSTMALGDRDAEVCKLHSSECYQDAEYSFEELPKRATNELPVSENDEDKLPISKNDEEEHKTGKSPCQKRKRTAVLSNKRKGTAVHFPVDEIEDGADENWEPALETSNASVMDDEDEDTGEGVTVKQKRTFKKQKRQEGAHNPSNDSKSRRGRKNSSEGHDQSNVDPQKRKFSHSTKRNRRRGKHSCRAFGFYLTSRCFLCHHKIILFDVLLTFAVDKALLETPEEEIDPTKLVMKDLILLAEAKERKLNKESAARSKSVPTQSTGNSSYHESPFDDDHLFASSQGLNLDDDENYQRVEESCPEVNYHCFMVRTPSERWSKSDTELFYKAIRQLGTDFEMITKLFPGRTRHQIKLKYKKEERMHPLQLADALEHRSKDHSHFHVLIEQLHAETEATSSGNAGSQEPAGEKEEVNDRESVEPSGPLNSHESRDVFEYDQNDSPSSSPQDTEKGDYKLSWKFEPSKGLLRDECYLD